MDWEKWAGEYYEYNDVARVGFFLDYLDKTVTCGADYIAISASDPNQRHDLIPCISAKVVGFLVPIFKENPDMASDWLKDDYKSDFKQSLAIVIIMAGVKPPKSYEDLVQIAKDRYSTPPLEDTVILRPCDIDMLWQAFFATGNKDYVDKILRARDMPENGYLPMDVLIQSKARLSLERNKIDTK